MMTITITAFEASPDRGRGLARDMRVRWALEEVGLPYDVRLLSFGEMKEPDHLARHPFGQIPTYEESGLTLFETGSIILHIAQNHPGLLPDDPDARARAITWMISALSTMEPVVIEREGFMLMERDKPWFEERLPILDGRVRNRLGQLSARLGDKDWLEDEFTAGDLMMVEVLLRPAAHMLLNDYPNLTAYVDRAQERPAFKRAFADQFAVFVASQAAG
jgi:glutathione S-transferase